jgi:hypothetical protein
MTLILVLLGKIFKGEEMNILKYDPECYKCGNEGWVFGEIQGDFNRCSICKNSRLLRISKHLSFNILLKFFGFFYDSLELINWVPEDVLEFNRLHNKAVKARVAKKILLDYATGYAVNIEKVKMASEVLAGPNAPKLFHLAEKEHFSGDMIGSGHELSKEFTEQLDSIFKN